MIEWIRVKEAGADLLLWWEHLVKGGIKQLAKVRGREIKKQRLGQLNILRLRQVNLTSKLNGEDPGILTDLTVVNNPITVGITMHLYKECWDVLGDPLIKVV